MPQKNAKPSSRKAAAGKSPAKRDRGNGTVRCNPERQAIYRLQAEMCRVLGHPERLALIDLLKEGERPAAELRRCLDLGKVSLSRHLKSLKQIGLVESRSMGREAYYRLSFCEIGSACSSIREVLALRLRQNGKLARAFLPAAKNAHRPGRARME